MTVVYGYYRTAADVPETGAVSLTPYLTVPNDAGLTRLITEKKVVSRLDEDGYVELEVIPSDDPGWRTEGQESVPYLVEERLEGEIRDRLVFILGVDPVDINLLPNVPVDTEGPVETPVPGPPGEGTITVGDTITGEPGTDAEVVNVGTIQDVVLDFTIPRGDPGSGSVPSTDPGNLLTLGSDAQMYGNDRAYTDAEAAKRMLWRGVHTTDGTAYQTNDVVRDGDYVMVALVDTTDRPAPAPEGSPAYLYEGTDPTTQVTAKRITYGQRFTNPTQPYYLTGWRAYVIAGNQYKAYSVLDPEGDAILELILEWEAGITGWAEFAISSSIIPVNTTFDLVVEVREPDPTPTQFVGNWNYATPQNPAAPAAGQIIHSAKSQGIMAVSKTDNDGGDRSAELAGLVVGDTIDALGDSWAIQSVTDRGDYIDFGVAPAIQSSPAGVTAFTFTTETATPITLIRDIDYWLTSPHNAKGIYSIDGGAHVLTDDAYGVDIKVQSVLVSPDWEIVTMAGGGGGGGGTGPHDHDARYINVDGDAMEGPLVVVDPVADDQAASKGYVDTVVAGSAAYTHDQALLASSWTVTHNLGRRPAVSAQDAAGTVLHGAVQHLSDNELVIEFAVSITGRADCT